MAPTEVLAEQHHRGIAELLDGFVVPAPDTLLGERPLHVALLSSRLSAPQRRMVLAQLASGEIDLAVGTHSLISEGWISPPSAWRWWTSSTVSGSISGPR